MSRAGDHQCHMARTYRQRMLLALALSREVWLQLRVILSDKMLTVRWSALTPTQQFALWTSCLSPSCKGPSFSETSRYRLINYRSMVKIVMPAALALCLGLSGAWLLLRGRICRDYAPHIFALTVIILSAVVLHYVLGCCIWVSPSERISRALSNLAMFSTLFDDTVTRLSHST